MDETRERGTAVENIDAGGWILLGDVRSDASFPRRTARVAGRAGDVEVRVGNDGATLCTLTVAQDRGRGDRHEVSMPMTWGGGAHDLLIVFGEPGTRLATIEFFCQS